jgi:thiol-disulfide isomerase/thioredoxin
VSNKPSRQSSHSAKVRAASGSGRSNTMWWWIGLGVLVVVIGVVAIAVGTSSDSGSNSGGTASASGGTVVPNGDLDYGSLDVIGTALPAAPDAGGTDTAIGQEIPTIQGQTFDGSKLTISPDGKPQVILVVAHWCPHCQAEVPRIQDWLNTNGMPDDVQLTTLATANNDQRTNFPAGPWLRKEGWTVPTVIDDKNSDGMAALGVTGFPSFIVVGADGKVVFRTSGEITMAQWEQLLESARTGTAPTA